MDILITKEQEIHREFQQDIKHENITSMRNINIEPMDIYGYITADVPKIPKEIWEDYLKDGHAEFEIVERTKVVLQMEKA